MKIMELFQHLQDEPVLLFTIINSAISLFIIIAIIVIIVGIVRNKKITKAALELKKVTDSIWAGIVNFVVEDDYKIQYASRGFYEMLGYSKDDPKLEEKTSVLDFIQDKEKEKLINLFRFQKGEKIGFEVTLVAEDERLINCFVNGSVNLSKDGKHIVSIMLVDFTEQKHMQARLLLEGERYRIVSELSNDVIFEYNIVKDKMIFIGKYKELFGRDSVIVDFIDKIPTNIKSIHPNERGIYEKFCKQLKEGQESIDAEFRMKDKLGEFIWCKVKAKTIHKEDGSPIRVIGTVVNINIHKREQEKLEYKATRDPLTGVYNKGATKKKVDMFVNGNKDGRHALLFLDFDNFKKVNDNFGHIQGDKVLKYVVERIRKVFNDGEIVGRVGGDEFVVFVGNFTQACQVKEKAQLLVNTMNTTYSREGKSIQMSGSIGVSVYPGDGINYNQLVDCADKACYQVKEDGKNNFRIYSSSM